MWGFRSGADMRGFTGEGDSLSGRLAVLFRSDSEGGPLSVFRGGRTEGGGGGSGSSLRCRRGVPHQPERPSASPDRRGRVAGCGWMRAWNRRRIPSPGGRPLEGPFLFVDFGEETVGTLRFRTSSAERVRIRIRYGETLAECVAEPARDQLLHRMLVEEILLGSGVQEWESRARVGFRFVRVEVFDSPAEVELSSFSVRSSLYPVTYRGYFHCSDSLLNRIWEAGRKTVHLCMQEYYLDGVKRDRFLWVGDTRAEALYNYYLFADQELFRFCWEAIASVQYADGAIPSEMGEGASCLWDYIAWYVIAFHDYRLFTGDDEFPLRLRKSLYAAVDYLSAQASPDGLIHVPENPYPTWMIVLNKAVGASPFLNTLYLRALRTAQEIAELAKDAAAACGYRTLADRLEPAVQQLLQEKPLAGEAGLSESSTGVYEILEQQFAHGESAGALERIPGKLGRPSFRRCRHPVRRLLYPGRPLSGCQLSGTETSLHQLLSWMDGRTPCALLPAEVAGIRPLEGGFRRFRVAPKPEDLESLEAVVPTPHGDIALSLTRTELVLRVPEGTTAEVELPAPVSFRRTLEPGIHRIPLEQ